MEYLPVSATCGSIAVIIYSSSNIGTFWINLRVLRKFKNISNTIKSGVSSDTVSRGSDSMK
jgi:hypothetical protein